MMRWLTLVALLLANATVRAQASDVTAIVGARVHVGDGTVVEGATVIVRGERIVQMGAGVAVPAGANVIDAAGKWLTPGLTLFGTALGLVEIEAEPAARDQAPDDQTHDPVRAAFDAADGVNPRSSLLPLARKGGVTTALATPQGGLVAGTSALIELRADASEQVTTIARAALHVNLDEGGAGAVGGARSLSLSRFREALDDARLYAQRRGAFDRRQMRESRISRLDLERLTEALAGRLPVVVYASRASDILRVLDLAKEYGLRLVLQGAEEAWVVADAIAEAGVPVIVRPFDNLARGFERLGTRHDNAALLAAAGVDVIITSDGPHRAHTLRQEAGNAVAHGLAWERALTAVTLAPARALGIEADHGTVAAGRVANLVVWDGDPFELSTTAVHVLVRGQVQPLRTRQDALVERYRVLP